MTHKFKKGQLVSYKFKNNAGNTEKGFGHIQARRARFYLIKPNSRAEIIKVYSNQIKEITIPSNALVVNETPKKDSIGEPNYTFDTDLIMRQIFELREQLEYFFFFTVITVIISACMILWLK